jgi:gluconate 2-dehydrogenase gamma chain
MTPTRNTPPTPIAEPAEPAVSRRLFLKSSGAALASTGVAIPVVAQEASPVAQATPVEPPEPLSPPAVTFFNDYEAELVAALTARILPGTADDPGAREAGVVYYIDRVLAGPNGGYTLKTYQQGPFLHPTEEETAVEHTSRTDIYQYMTVSSELTSRYGFQSILSPQEIYRRGLDSVDAHCQATYKLTFLELGEQQQDEVLTAMEADEATGFDAPSGAAFFTKLRNDTIEGVFSDPMYGGNKDMVGWKLIGYPGARGFYTADDMANTEFKAEPMSISSMSDMGH